MNKVITFHGDVETTSYFMTQIEKQLEKDGYDVCPFYFDVEKKGQPQISQKVLALYGEKLTFLTFNFAGIYGDDLWIMENGEAVVDSFHMTCINIIVDHPYHYHVFLEEQLMKRADFYMQICIDQKHIEYMQKYFPNVKLGPFMPSGGTEYFSNKSFKDRTIDVIFTGTYMRPDCFDVFIDRNGEEYSQFYHKMIDESYDDPRALLEDIVRKDLIEEIPEVTEPEIRETLGHIQFLDYYIRFKRRGEVIRTLVDAGIKVCICGSGWETLDCEHPENMILHPYLTSEECLKMISDAKLSLNILPSFHSGAHDRIFNSMLCGAVSVTDSNEYLDKILVDGENAIIYSHSNLKYLVNKIKNFLSDDDKMNSCSTNVKSNCDIESNKESNKKNIRVDKTVSDMEHIAGKGYQLASHHTWAERTKLIESCIENINN